MSNYKRIKNIIKSEATLEGAGVRLKRAFGFFNSEDYDPFLLLDDFHSENPDDYMSGFPWHPHRGIETVTYMINGAVEHGDSLGNRGIIESGDVQWMTAGSGIIHQEMPLEIKGMMQGFQLWVNLPAKDKMMNPRYRDVVASSIPAVEVEGGIEVKVIAGEFKGTKGPVMDLLVDVEYLDVSIPLNSKFTHTVADGFSTFAYIFKGEGVFEEGGDIIEKENLILFDKGTSINISTNDSIVRFLLISGAPLKEPVAWRGPIVMNTEEELRIAFEEYGNGTFIKHE